MDTKKLRQKILDLAIRGKLVPQDPKDEPASVLLERIRAKKERLIKEGKIKRSKKSATDDEFEAPFEIPESWEWCLLPDLCSIPITDGTHQTPTYTDKEHGIPFISSKDVTSQKINWNNIKFITRDLHESLYKRIAPQRDDILLAKNGTTGVAALVEDDFIFDIYVTLAVIRPIKDLVLPIYLWRVINSSFCKKQFDNHLTGIGLPNLHLTDIKKTIIPLPPLVEQKRIANEIERWFAVIDALESNEGDLLKAIDQTKSKILDLAIHGKLVPQDPNDEPAVELLKRINPKFESCDDEQYESIPQGWQTCKVKDVFQINPKTSAPDSLDAAFVPMANIEDQYNNRFVFEKKKWGEIKRGYTHFQNGDIAVAKISPCLENRKSVVFDNLPNGIGAGTTELNVFRSEIVKPLYGLYFFKTNHFISNCVGTFNGVVGQQRVATKIVEEIEFYLPPLNEQLLIATRIEELFAVLDSIKASLE